MLRLIGWCPRQNGLIWGRTSNSETEHQRNSPPPPQKLRRSHTEWVTTPDSYGPPGPKLTSKKAARSLPFKTKHPVHMGVSLFEGTLLGCFYDTEGKNHNAGSPLLRPMFDLLAAINAHLPQPSAAGLKLPCRPTPRRACL